jgi:hypothetical protein
MRDFFIALRGASWYSPARKVCVNFVLGGFMLPSKLAEQVAEKIKSLPSDKQQEVLKSLESFVADATREMPRKYTGLAWANALPESNSDEQRPNVWRFTAGARPNPFE